MDKIGMIENGKFQFYEGGVRQKRDFLTTEHETLRRATLLKQRKLSTQLKLDTIHRQLTNSRRHVTTFEQSDAAFYRGQAAELTDELEHISMTLARAEKDAYFARRRLLRLSGLENYGPMSASQPITTGDTLEERFGGLRHCTNLLSFLAMKKPFLAGELRPVASLSSLSSSTASIHHEEPPSSTTKDRKHFKSPFKAIGDFMDFHILSRIPGSNRKTKSADNISKMDSDYRCCRNSNPAISERISVDVIKEKSSMQEKIIPVKNNNEDEVLEVSDSTTSEKEEFKSVNGEKCDEIDPKILAEIEDFEKMAAHYIREHTPGHPPAS